MAKLWQKGNLDENELAKQVETFTVGDDRNLDTLLAKADVLGSLAHTKMLAAVGLLPQENLAPIHQELKCIYAIIEKGNFSIHKDSEDIHSDIEFRLTEKLGNLGKQIHSGRSRNDQVLLDLKIFTRFEIERIANATQQLFDTLLKLSIQHKDKLLPGYTHLQLAMPSSFGLWFGAYAESLVDDMETMYAAFTLANKNPLGSGAGYGGSFPLNRKMTTELLGFADLNYNVVYAQMNRGKMEKTVVAAIANIAATLAKLAMDACLYLNQNFGFISFPDVLTTGSSIMPHKKNPDVFELIRAKCNKLQSLPNQFNLILSNLPSGYHRDLQIIKEDYMHSFSTIISCLEMSNIMLSHIEIKDNILEDEKYKLLFTVETVNQLVNEGMPFRDAYITVGKQVETGNYKKPSVIHHTHEGSIGNLCHEEIEAMMQNTMAQFPFQKINSTIEKLLA
ncbi:MAG TPA: argininosuccinate lyase [Chitinophagales bacterium]|nr:argininosuccinate lyase [Chitinophagales bacterium]HMW12005.1 argininosuccinate lyase [Chitinophagales bacterium]HMX59683.1 argininosuccinate lyase [Chitinophagales bacterium]HMY22715.1 argininosuccinate lyase [Chitinophagales bacterium]HMZ33130.1 argininosuccinate lyase [Chitinophagales bacterium]